ncbi:MBL fold metallo-hydrolase [Ostreiculturibacter nitratireducens]|uniref:MBL fold metallo-hydrolase n=1 Tax=Ostreiculturibacter nitratireducens TaxID=3075226 RepID=UPI0031B61803
MKASADSSPLPGLPEVPEEGLRRVLAPNPSPMTFRGTNTYILGEGRVAVIDPGPALPAHYDAILAALRAGESVSHILVTHSHLDHSPLARPLAEATSAPIYAFGTSEAGRSELMRELAASGLAEGGEGVDRDFQPDETLSDGDEIGGSSWSLRALHTPGHFGNHLCFLWGDAAFSGDHVMGWATSLVSPPDGDMGAYMESLARLASCRARVLYPGHGSAIEDPAARMAYLAAHRRERESQILAALAKGPANAATLASRVYTETPPALLPAAARNVFAHLIDLWQKNRVDCIGRPAFALPFSLA